MKLDITGPEIAEYIENSIKEFKQNPLLNIDILSQLGMVLTSIGILKSNTPLRILGDLLAEAPERLRPLLSLKYSLVGTIGEFQTMIATLTENTITSLTETLLELAKHIRQGEINDKTLLEIIGKLYDTIVTHIPTITLETTSEE